MLPIYNWFKTRQYHHNTKYLRRYLLYVYVYKTTYQKYISIKSVWQFFNLILVQFRPLPCPFFQTNFFSNGIGIGCPMLSRIYNIFIWQRWRMSPDGVGLESTESLRRKYFTTNRIPINYLKNTAQNAKHLKYRVKKVIQN